MTPVGPSLALPPGCTAALFDCDGTLVDTLPAHAAAWQVALGPHGVWRDRDWYAARAGLSSADVLALLSAQTPGLDVVAVDGARRAQLARLLPLVREIEIVGALARRLAAAGVPLAVASGGSRDNVTASLAAAGLAGLFPVVVTREDVVRGKPAPDVFLAAAAALGVEPGACGVFEDSDEGLAAAGAAGMRTVDVRRGIRPARPRLARLAQHYPPDGR